MACYEYKGVKYTEEDLVKLLQSQQPKTRRILELQSDLFQKGRDKEDLVSKKGKYYRVLNINFGKDVTFEPKSYSEAFEQGEDGKWYPKHNKYGGYWKSNIPEISASKNIGSAIMGNWTASGMPQTTEFFIYELEDGVEPDYDISHLEIGDFKQLQEVRYRKPVKGKLIGEFKLTPDIYKIFNENYDLMSEDGGINKHYELEDKFEKKYGYRPYDEKAPEGAVEIFNKIQDDYWKEQSLTIEKALQSIHNKYDEQVKQNQFLQLLNKDNNWVRFFIRAIIQQTAKERIYEASLPDIEEKVLSLQKEGKLKIDCK